MMERFVWLGAVVLLGVPMAVIGLASSAKMKPVEYERPAFVEHEHLSGTNGRPTGTDERYANATDEVELEQETAAIHGETHGETSELPWWMQMFLEGPGSVASGGVELGGAVLSAFAAMPEQIAELVRALPELSGAVSENPWLIPMFGAAVVSQIADDLRTVATTTKRSEAMPLLGAMVADRISPGKFLGFVKKSRQAQRVANVARRATKAARASLSKVGLGRLSLCFVAGTLVHGADGHRAIETLELGDRVATTDLSLAPSDSPDETWKRVSIEMQRGPNDVVEIELLRSPEWFSQTRAVDDAKIHLSIPEMGLDGNARVLRVQDAPHFATGRGHLVLATFKSRARDVIELRFEGSSEVIAATSRHRLYSLEANDFVAAGALRVGERLRGRDGAVVVASVTKKSGEHTVYNIEVDTDHSYFVGRVGVLSHNNDPYVYPGLPANAKVPGVPTTVDLVDDTVRWLTFDDFQPIRTLVSGARSDVLLLRDMGDRLYVFREVGGHVDVLARTQLHTFLAQSANLPTVRTHPGVYWRNVGLVQDLPRDTRAITPTAFDKFIELTAAYGDVRAIDYIAGLHRTRDTLRLLEVEPKTFAVLPFAAEPLWWSTDRATAALSLPSSISDRLYDVLATFEHREDALRASLRPYASRVDVNALIDETRTAVREVLEEVGSRPIFVLPHASPYVTVHPVALMPEQSSAFGRASQIMNSYVRGPVSRVTFPGLRPTDALTLRGITPDTQLSRAGMAAYREQVQLAYYELWTRQRLLPTNFATADDYVSAITHQAQLGFGAEMRLLLYTRHSILQRLHIDIGLPYDNPRYLEMLRNIHAVAGDRAKVDSLVRHLGTLSMEELGPGRDLVGNYQQRALQRWRSAHDLE